MVGKRIWNQKRMDISSVSISVSTVEPAVVNPDIISKKQAEYECTEPERYKGKAPNAVITIHVRETTSIASFGPMFISLRRFVAAITDSEKTDIAAIVCMNALNEVVSEWIYAIIRGMVMTTAMNSMMNAMNLKIER